MAPASVWSFRMTAMKNGGGGCIINIASAAGIKPVAGNAVYGTSKAAIGPSTSQEIVESRRGEDVHRQETAVVGVSQR